MTMDAPGKAYDVSITPCDDYDEEYVEKALRAVLEPIHGLDFVQPGMTVGDGAVVACGTPVLKNVEPGTKLSPFGTLANK